MPTLQIRNLSETVYTALKARAKTDRRSIQQEAAWVLEIMLTSPGGLHRPNWSRVDSLRALMSRRYGTLPDSTPLIRTMRDER